MNEAIGEASSLRDQPEKLLEQAKAHLQRGQPQEAQIALRTALDQVPDHPALLLPLGVSLHMQGQFEAAAAVFHQVAMALPTDPSIHNNLGSALGASGDPQGAVEALKRACELAPERPNYWYNLAKALEGSGEADKAVAALTQLLALDPGDAKARLQRADLNKACGRLEQAEQDLRWLLGRDLEATAAWVRLVNLKVTQFSADDLSDMGRVYRGTAPRSDSRISMGFAYGQALESSGRFAEAFEVISQANASKRSAISAWDPASFHYMVQARKRAFSEDVVCASDPTLGQQAILIFGMPRSGTTLLEHMLSSHPKIEGAGEIGDLSIVIQEESVKRGEALEQWYGRASSEDWSRLGRAYMDRTAKWRERRPMFIDKELGKWTLMGAARAMLPGAHFIYCHRDPVETCWSCFKLEFDRGVEYSYDLEHLAAFWEDCRDMVDFLHIRFPGLVLECGYERLIEATKEEITRVLEFCGLSFDPACLQLNQVRRQVWTASAGQVRQPVGKVARVAPSYGRLLDPLHATLRATEGGGLIKR